VVGPELGLFVSDRWTAMVSVARESLNTVNSLTLKYEAREGSGLWTRQSTAIRLIDAAVY
jgi:hypothetical protein